MIRRGREREKKGQREGEKGTERERGGNREGLKGRDRQTEIWSIGTL
jgi:hypothetical protein